jgi:hypothetical protein
MAIHENGSHYLIRSRPWAGPRQQSSASTGRDTAAARRGVAPLLGAIVGSLASVPDETLGYILCIYSGFFIYMGATDLLPEAHAHASWRK